MGKVQLIVRKCIQCCKLLVALLVIFVVMALFYLAQYKLIKKLQKPLPQTPEELYESLITRDEAKIVPKLGEGGFPIPLRGIEKKLGKQSVAKYAINVHLSDRLPYFRKIRETRHPLCKEVLYDAELPSASVVIIFYNEPYSILLRTVRSVLETVRRTDRVYTRAKFKDKVTGKRKELGYPGQNTSSPYLYIKELILVDDASTFQVLKGKLEYYIRTRIGKDLDVKFVRVPLRIGLTRARLVGAREAIGDTIVFLDAHCEPSTDWLRPLLQRLKNKYDVALVPVIDFIDAKNFFYFTGVSEDPSIIQVGGFSFGGYYTWITLPAHEVLRRSSSIDPTWSPTMAGGLFAMNRKYFFDLGAYDEEMAGWGGENLEMSFRVWMCGGTLETIPCSRIGHIFRPFLPYSVDSHDILTLNKYVRKLCPHVPPTAQIFATASAGDQRLRVRLTAWKHGINTARMAEVWMDDYKEFFYLQRPDLKNSPYIGDVTSRKVLREKLNCRSFQWFLENVYPQKFVPLRDCLAFGRFQNYGTNVCLGTHKQHAKEGKPLQVYECSLSQTLSQTFILTFEGMLRTEFKCAEIFYKRRRHDYNSEEVERRKVFMYSCGKIKKDQTWTYLPTMQLKHTGSGLCLDATLGPTPDVYARPCTSEATQQWDLEFSHLFNTTVLPTYFPDPGRDEAFSRIRNTRQNFTYRRTFRDDYNF